MANTRRNRKVSRKNRKVSRRNRKQRGAGFFDFFRSKPAEVPMNTSGVPPVANAPVANAPVAVANAPVTNAPVAVSTSPSFMNRIRGVTSSVGSSLRTARNTASSKVKNYGQKIRNVRNTMRGRPYNGGVPGPSA